MLRIGSWGFIHILILVMLLELVMSFTLKFSQHRLLLMLREARGEHAACCIA
jgi:uncharacterized membrane protein